MPKTVAVAVVHDVPPTVFIAENEDVLNWILALNVVAQTPAANIEPSLRERLRDALKDEQWGNAVAAWMEINPTVDVYPSHELYIHRDVEMAPHELEFSPLFRD